MSNGILKRSQCSSHFYTRDFVNSNFVLHGHLHLRLVLVLSGILNMEIDAKHYEISEGQGVFIPSLISHSFSSATQNTFKLIEFSREHLDFLFHFAKGMKVTNHLFSFSPAVSAALSEYIAKEGFYDDEAIIQAVLAPIAYEVKMGCQLEPCATDVSMLLRIFKYVEENFNDDISLSTVGASLGVHPASVSRVISKSTGDTFNHYLRHVRSTYAAKLITFGDMTFSEIAFASGFGSIRSFNRAFYDIYGVTPQEYKRKFVQNKVRK